MASIVLQENNVIDNKKIILKDELLKILPKTENASIAVGYFFISGLSAITESLSNVNNVRLLISNNTDKVTAESLIEGFHSIDAVRVAVNKNNFINEDRKSTVIDDSKINTKKLLEHMQQTHDDKTVVESLIQMMKTEQLEVKIYPKEKLHAKAYIFQPRDTDFAQGLGIVGSSNLSLAGISHNSELNLKTYNSSDVNKLLAWFDDLWKNGLEFTEDFKLILKNSWAGKTYSPQDLFLKAAYLEYKYTLDDTQDNVILEKTFPKLFPFQKIAVNQCRKMIEDYDGVIIGDVVGLGKTYVGIAILKYLQLESYRPLIICPPTLIPMWEKFCVDYEIDAKILSRGQLSRDSYELYQDYRYKDRDLVLIDESHHFRNNTSRQYENLHQFMQTQEAKAILLTATPFSNSAKDIKNQIMLFHLSPKTLIPPANETDLDKYFIQVKNGNANLVDLLMNIMIRRTRRYVLNQWGQKDQDDKQYLVVDNKNKYFPKREMMTLRYDINKVYQGKYEAIEDYLTKEKLTFARYSVGLYVKNEYKDVKLYKELGVAGKKLVGLIRTLLLKRMESSLEAFKQSIQHYIDTHKIFIELLAQKIIPIGDVSYKAMYDIAESDPDSIYDLDIVDELKKKIRESGETKYKFEAFNIDKLRRDMENDLTVFEAIKKLIHNLSEQTDDKLHQLQSLLDNDYTNKKVLIFTEFATTAQYLNDQIKWKGVKEYVDSTTGNSIQCARRFDPDNNPSTGPRPNKSDEISLLISTDVLSEGVNLQAGQVIINYDFHWNPIRLIQRAGRIDRIGSKNEIVTVHNFLLDPKMKADFNLESIVDAKINDIQRIIGEDYKILKPEEQINAQDLYAIYKGDESLLDREDNNLLEPSIFEKILRDVQLNKPELWEDITNIPDGIRCSENIKSGGQLLLACESGSIASGKVRKYYLITSKKIKEISIQNVLKILKSNDSFTYSLPSDYDELVSNGWKKFVEDANQIKARTLSRKLTRSQNWILERLIKMSRNNKLIDKKEEIETLRKGYSIPFLKGKLNREILKIKKSEMDDIEIINNLSQLYIHYSLQKHVTRHDEESKSSRILYSKYVRQIGQ